MRPRPRAIISGSTSWVVTNVPRRFTSSVCPLVEVDFPRGTDRTDDTGIVEQEVCRSELSSQALDRVAHRTCVGDVGRRRACDPAALLDHRDRLGQLLGGARDQPDRHSRVCEVHRGHAPDPAAAAGDERHLSVEPCRRACHVVASLSAPIRPGNGGRFEPAGP
jgi:hypothetical protein